MSSVIEGIRSFCGDIYDVKAMDYLFLKMDDAEARAKVIYSNEDEEALEALEETFGSLFVERLIGETQSIQQRPFAYENWQFADQAFRNARTEAMIEETQALRYINGDQFIEDMMQTMKDDSSKEAFQQTLARFRVLPRRPLMDTSSHSQDVHDVEDTAPSDEEPLTPH